MTNFFNDQTFARGMLEDLKVFAEEAAKQAVEAILKPSANPQEIANVQRIASSMSALNWISRLGLVIRLAA
ncbi:hypothetical protein [Nostoc sp. FACHB-190]|uniref:hypothetical protein n=1 Tax=Nostoc sp. FACHB-190 TaxID=2692838 RepID=UPI0016860D54|nr:hypothetical protein [Nostoc sp. FACHB-190]MBD2300970.1 hypothetical protein [Nostoc sp. FACHB-190]